jgi:hypothetical protein
MLRRESSSAGVDTRMRIGPRGEKKGIFCLCLTSTSSQRHTHRMLGWGMFQSYKAAHINTYWVNGVKFS